MRKTRTKPTTRTQAERSASTQKRILRAAIECLHRKGYSATSTVAVADMAGVSRGAMLHQYPNKTDMMAAVLDAVYEQQSAYYRRALSKIDDPAERLVSVPRVAWTAFRSPAGVAQMEIFLAARSDAELKDVVREGNRRVDTESRLGIVYLARDAGITDIKLIDAMWALGVSTLRGLQTQWINDLQKAPASEAIGLLETLWRNLIAAHVKRR
jgi:AcrR family transcriptional regulator